MKSFLSVPPSRALRMPAANRTESGLLLAALILSMLIIGCDSASSGGSKVPPDTSVRSEIQPDNGSDSPQGVGQETPVNLTERVTRSMNQGRYDDAEEGLRQMLVENPDDVTANFLFAQVLAATERRSEAIEVLDRLKELDPGRADDIEALSVGLLAKVGRNLEAMERLTKLVSRRPDVPQLRQQLAGLCEQNGFSFDANSQVRQLLKTSDVSLEELVGLVFPTRSRISLEQIREASADQLSGYPVMSVASTLMIEGDPRSALQQMDSSELIARRHPAAVALRARILATAQMNDELRRCLVGAPLASRRYFDFWIACGTLANSEKNPVAVDCFLEAMRLEPGSVNAIRGMVNALELAQRTEKAALFLQRINALDELRTSIKRVRAATVQKPEAFSVIAETLMDAGHPLESIAWQEYVIRRSNPSPQALQQIALYKARVLGEYPSGVDLSATLGGLEPQQTLIAKWIKQLGAVSPSLESRPKETVPLVTEKVTPEFVNVADLLGIDFRYLNARMPVERYFRIFESFGGGVACLDFDRDGMTDLYFAQAGCDPPKEESAHPNALYRANASTFIDVTKSSRTDNRGYTTGVTAGDWNQDGFPDLLICNLGTNQLLINQGDGTFRDSGLDVVSDKDRFTSSAAIADVTGDGLADIVEINYLDDPSIFVENEKDADGEFVLPGPLQFEPSQDRVLITGREATSRSVLLGTDYSSDARAGLGLIVSDIDHDGENDIFVANDLYANQYWISESQTLWQDQAVGRGLAFGAGGKPMACMGIAMADFDRNGRNDLHICNFEGEWSNQYMQSSAGQFVDSAVRYNLDRISYAMLGFGVQAVDVDNDSHLDLVVGNGHVEDLTAKGKAFAMPTQVLMQRAGSFESASVRGDDDYWGGLHFSRGMARCDFNRDGRVDLVISDLKEPATLLENRTASAHHVLRVRVVGFLAGRDAIGAHVTLQFGDTSLIQTVQTGDGYMSRNEEELTFGTGTQQSIDFVEVTWPTGETERFDDVRIDEEILIIQGQGQPWTVRGY